MEFHSVKVQKANAMNRFHTTRKLENALRFFNFCVALLVFSRSSWFPTTLQIFYHFYTVFVSLFNHPFYVFLLGNVIILFIYALSGNKGARNDVCDEFLNNESRQKITADTESLVTLNNLQEQCPEKHKGMVDSDETVTAVTETTKTRTTKTTTTTTSSCTSTNCEKFSKSKCYRRVESESFERRIVVGSSRQLKRVNTEVSREVVRYGGELERRLCSVEKLSDEEFNRTVEDFIAMHRRMQWDEHRESRKTEYFL